jgi:hypothetical protein
MDLNKMVNNAMAKMTEEGKVQEIIESRITETIESVVKDAFGTWSTFSKELKKEIEEKIEINLSELDIPSYNKLIQAVIKDKLDDQIATDGVARINASLGTLLSSAKEEYKLSELVEEMSEEVEKDEIDYDCCHEMTMHVDQSFSLSTIISLDPEPGKSEYECKYRFWVNNKTGTISNVDVGEGGAYGKTREVRDFDARAIMRGFHGLDETLFKMYARGSKLIIDEEDVELEVSNPEHE